MADIKKELKKDSHSVWSRIKRKTYRAGTYLIIAFTTLGTPDFAQAKDKSDAISTSETTEYFTIPKRTIDYQVDTLAQYNPTVAYFMKNRQSVTQNYYQFMDHDPIQELSTLAHEQKHRDNSKFDLANTPMSLVQQYKSQTHNEISASVVELLQLRQMYIEANTPEEQLAIKKAMSVNFDFYVEALNSTEKDKIDPLSTSPKDFDKEMSFIINSIKHNWMEKNAKTYNKSHTLVTLGTFSIHNYNTLQNNDANYQRYLDHVYTIGGINFKHYMTEDIDCYNQNVIEAQKLIEQNAPRNKVDELLSGQKSKKTILDKNYTPETYTSYTGKPLYVKWSKTKRVSDILTAEIYDFSGNSLKQYRDYLEIKQSSMQNKKSILKFDKRTKQRASMSKKKINIANNTYVITPDMI